MVPLEAPDEFSGSGHANWPGRRAVAASDRSSVYQRVAPYWAFGRVIANSDMHQGNLSFLWITQRPVMLAPLYDMLPMAFARQAAR
ncbi:HipA domain-containing protein [Serratia ureilytica]